MVSCPRKKLLWYQISKVHEIMKNANPIFHNRLVQIPEKREASSEVGFILRRKLAGMNISLAASKPLYSAIPAMSRIKLVKRYVIKFHKSDTIPVSFSSSSKNSHCNSGFERRTPAMIDYASEIEWRSVTLPALCQSRSIDKGER